jgi:hypothetical protein
MTNTRLFRYGDNSLGISTWGYYFEWYPQANRLFIGPRSHETTKYLAMLVSNTVFYKTNLAGHYLYNTRTE